MSKAKSKTEIEKLHDWMVENNIKHERREWLDGIQLYISNDYIRLSCICRTGSYGFDKGLIEMYDFIEEPEGWLTAEDCEQRIKEKYWEKVKKHESSND